MITLPQTFLATPDNRGAPPDGSTLTPRTATDPSTRLVFGDLVATLAAQSVPQATPEQTPVSDEQDTADDSGKLADASTVSTDPLTPKPTFQPAAPAVSPDGTPDHVLENSALQAHSHDGLPVKGGSQTSTQGMPLQTATQPHLSDHPAPVLPMASGAAQRGAPLLDSGSVRVVPTGTPTQIMTTSSLAPQPSQGQLTNSVTMQDRHVTGPGMPPDQGVPAQVNQTTMQPKSAQAVQSTQAANVPLPAQNGAELPVSSLAPTPAKSLPSHTATQLPASPPALATPVAPNGASGLTGDGRAHRSTNTDLARISGLPKSKTPDSAMPHRAPVENRVGSTPTPAVHAAIPSSDVTPHRNLTQTLAHGDPQHSALRFPPFSQSGASVPSTTESGVIQNAFRPSASAARTLGNDGPLMPTVTAVVTSVVTAVRTPLPAPAAIEQPQPTVRLSNPLTPPALTSPPQTATHNARMSTPLAAQAAAPDGASAQAPLTSVPVAALQTNMTLGSGVQMPGTPITSPTAPSAAPTTPLPAMSATPRITAEPVLAPTLPNPAQRTAGRDDAPRHHADAGPAPSRHITYGTPAFGSPASVTPTPVTTPQAIRAADTTGFDPQMMSATGLDDLAPLSQSSESTRPTASLDAPPPQATRPEVARFASQLADILVRTQDRKAEIALNPDELGRVRMAMSVTDTGISITIAADRPETLDLMRRHIDSLTDAFRALGHHDVSFDFSGGQDTDASSGSGLASTDSEPGSDLAMDRTAAPESRPTSIAAPQGLDLRL